jgi:hypothetical protein
VALMTNFTKYGFASKSTQVLYLNMVKYDSTTKVHMMIVLVVDRVKFRLLTLCGSMSLKHKFLYM